MDVRQWTPAIGQGTGADQHELRSWQALGNRAEKLWIERVCVNTADKADASASDVFEVMRGWGQSVTGARKAGKIDAMVDYARGFDFILLGKELPEPNAK